MKKRIFASFVILLALLLGSFSSAFAALRADPVPLSPFNQRDRFDTDLFSGSATYEYPIKVPKGTNDLTPEISLSYNSAGVRDPNMRNGIGWQLTQNYIERDVNFTPTNTGDDKYKLHFKGGVYDLIYVASENRYHTKTESFINIQKLTGGQNEQVDYWQVITQDGTKYRFGYQSQSELVCNGRSYIGIWNLDQVTDTHNNNIYFTYSESNGASYLSQIKYNNDQQRIVDFTYASNPYQRQAYAQGCNVLESSRLSNIQVKVNTNLVRQYDFNYITSGNNQSLLQSISEKGSDGSALPPTTFDYKPEIKNWATTSAAWLNNAPVDAHLEMSTVAFADANGDGLFDIVRTYPNDPANGWSTWKVLLNQGNSWSTQYQTWISAPIDADLGRTDTRLLDVTGDNLPDIVKSNLNGTDASRSTWKVWRNTGTSWSTTEEIWVNNAHVSSAAFTQADTLVMDINGDNLADIVRTTYDNNTTWKVFRNTGSSWSTQTEEWLVASIDAHLDQPFVRLMDVNSDGLPDIVKTSTGSSWWVWKNTGSSWSTTQETWLSDPTVDAHFQKNDVAVSDVNGDGLVDIVKSIDGGLQDTWKVLLNKGNSWSTQWEIWIDPSSYVDADAQANNVRVADVTGDSLSDLVKTIPNGGSDTWKVWINNGNSPDLLASIKTPQGGIISFDYAKSTQYSNTGSDLIADLPFNVWVVSKMTTNNGLSNTQGTNDVTTYSYKDGFYKWQDGEFRGFKEVNTTEPNSSKKQYVFNQDDALKGMLAEVQTRDNQGNPFVETENTWSSSQSNGVYTVNLTQEKNYTYDGSATGPKVSETDYQYDSYGNVTKKSELGDIGTTNDERFSYFEYTMNPSLWIINSVKHTYLNGSDDATKISENWFYYDGHAWTDDAPTKGDVTKDVKWSNVAGLSSPTTLYEYDSYGNQTKITDANNRATQQTYDASATYPISTTNAKNQTTTTNYDLGTGNLLSKTDPNGFVTSYVYDVFGRISKEIKPYDSASFPTVNYQYFNDGTAPEGTLVSKRQTSGASGTLDSYTWFDGLGRKAQTRAPAENTGNQIVTDTFYDPTGEIAKQTVPHLDILSTSYLTPLLGTKNTTASYDPIGRVSIIINPKGGSKTVAYDHWKETVIDENGHIKREYVNAYNKINKVEEVNGVNIYTTNYEYDSRDNLTKITDAVNNISTFTYDSLGRKISQVDPDIGTWQYEYDGVGNLTKQIDNRNISVLKTYDDLDRITKTDYPTDTDTTYTYDGNGKIGTLASLIDTAGSLNFSYDNRLRKTQETRVIDGNTWITQYAYDAMDRMTSRTNPDGEVISYSFNPQGEINSVGGILTNIDYNALGKITKKDFANNLTTNYTYNSDDFRLNRIQTNNLQDMNYSYDSVGNVLGITNNLLTKTQTFGYDDLDRLKTASETGGFNYSYDYNAIGNITKFTNAGVDMDYTYGQSAGVHALTSSTESVVNPTPTLTPTPTPTPIPPSGSTPVVRSSTSGSASTGGLTLTKPTGTVNGDLLIITASADLSASENVTYTIPAGWTQLLPLTRSDATSAGNNLQVWYKIANSEPANYTITPDHSNLIGGSVVRIDGQDPNSPISVNGFTASTTGEASAPAVTTDAANSLIFRIATWDQSKTLNAIPSGHTQTYLVHVSGHDNWGGYKEQATAGNTGVAQLDLSSGSPYVGFTVAVRPSQGGATPTPTPTATLTPTPTSAPTPGSGSTPVVRASNSGSVSTGALTLTKPTGTVNGDLLIITASADLSASENVTYTIPAGWTQLLPLTRSDATSAGNNLQVWYKVASLEPSDYTITPDHSNLIGGSIIRIDGQASSSPIDIGGVNASLTGEASAPSVTTTVNNDLVLRLVTWDQSKTLNAIPSGHTQIYRVDVSGHDNWGGHKEQATAGITGVAQFDLSSGAPYVGYTVTIRPMIP